MFGALRHRPTQSSLTASRLRFGKTFLISSKLSVMKTIIVCQIDRISGLTNLCIDQESDQERNHQVQLMSEIYRSCRYVTIWLHGPWKGIARLFNRNQCRTSLKNIFQHEYFTRLWILQEVVARSTSRSLLRWCLAILGRFGGVPSSVYSRCSQYSLLLILIPEGPNLNPTLSSGLLIQDHHFCATQVGYHWAWCIEQFAKMNCQLPHDKVYGLLGLVIPEQRPDVDYNKPLIELFLEVLWIVLQIRWNERNWNFYMDTFCFNFFQELGIWGTKGFLPLPS